MQVNNSVTWNTLALFIYSFILQTDTGYQITMSVLINYYMAVTYV